MTAVLAPDPRDDLVERMASLSDREFIEVVYAAVQRRRRPGLEDWNGHWVLAEAEQVGRGPWDVDYLAAAREEVEDLDRVLCRETTCPRCRHPIPSWARVVACPICSRTVFCS